MTLRRRRHRKPRAGDNRIFVYDVDSKEYVCKAAVGADSVRDGSLGAWKDGCLYNLTEKEVFRLDPESFADSPSTTARN